MELCLCLHVKSILNSLVSLCREGIQQLCNSSLYLIAKTWANVALTIKSLRCHFDLADYLKPKREEFARFSKQLKDKDIKSLRLNSSQFIALLPRSLFIKPNTLYLPVYSLLRLPQTVQPYCMIFPSRNFLAISAKVYNIYMYIYFQRFQNHEEPATNVQNPKLARLTEDTIWLSYPL